MADVTQILDRVQRGNLNAAEELLPVVYAELRGIAAGMMAREKPGQTLQATALVHEAWLRLGGDQQIAWKNRAHIFSAAAEAMRRILIDRARKRLARASSGLDSPEELIESRIQVRAPETELLALHDVLDHFAEVDPDGARLVKLRYFVGMDMAEAADALGVSHRHAERLWTFAKAWLREAIQRER